VAQDTQPGRRRLAQQGTQIVTTSPQESSEPQGGPGGHRADNPVWVVRAPVLEGHVPPSSRLVAVLS